MKREAAALGLLLLLMAASWLCARQTEALSDRVCACLERSENALKRGETAQALGALETGLRVWEQGRRRLELIFDRQDTEAVREELFTLEERLRGGETELSVSYARLRWRLKELCARQRLCLETVLTVTFPSGAWSAPP